MNTKILCVDDEPHILDAMKRQFRKKRDIDTAVGAAAALEAIRTRGPYAVVLSDMRMPDRDGVSLLEEVRRIAPDTIRMMLTGNSDQATAIKAVNVGQVFRFLTKPAAFEDLDCAFAAGVEQYRLVTAERDVLERTLKGSIKLLTDLLETADRAGLARARADCVREIAGLIGITDTWEIETAALLSRVGFFTLPPELADLVAKKKPLKKLEKELVDEIPEIGHRLLSNIPRLENVARIVLYHRKNYDGTGLPDDGVLGVAIPLGARILRLSDRILRARADGLGPHDILVQLEKQASFFDPHLLDAVRRSLAAPVAPAAGEEIPFSRLIPGQIVVLPILDEDGRVLLAAGRVVTESILERLRHYDRLRGVQRTVRIA